MMVVFASGSSVKSSFCSSTRGQVVISSTSLVELLSASPAPVQELSSVGRDDATQHDHIVKIGSRTQLLQLQTSWCGKRLFIA